VALKAQAARQIYPLIIRAKRLANRVREVGPRVPLQTIIRAPESFAASVQAAFDLSHLIRDGKVSIVRDDEHGFVVNIVMEDGRLEAANAGKKEARRRQCIFCLRADDWEKLKAKEPVGRRRRVRVFERGPTWRVPQQDSLAFCPCVKEWVWGIEL
jgi:hypothetical protein